MSSPDRSSYHFIPPAPPLRSAMKRSSRPSTPASSILPSSPLVRPSPLSRGTSPAPTWNSLDSPRVSQSPHQNTIPLVASQGYQPKVSFDTFENPQASMFSYTLHVQSDGYARNRNTRVFLCAASKDQSGDKALDWTLDSLVQDGDELIVFRGVEMEDLEKDHDAQREDARDLMRQIEDKCIEYDPERKLSIIVEYIAGKVPETIDRLIALYRPDSVVVGTRGLRGMIQAWGAAFGAPGVGSVSKYCLSHSPVPIIVVRPDSKVRKAMAKRRADPKRGKHFDETTKMRRESGATSVPMFATLTQ